jgi:hypothetical protein
VPLRAVTLFEQESTGAIINLGVFCQMLFFPSWESLQLFTKNPVTLFGRIAFILVAPLLMTRGVAKALYINDLASPR